jgi:hypothetical protein
MFVVDSGEVVVLVVGSGVVVVLVVVYGVVDVRRVTTWFLRRVTTIGGGARSRWVRQLHGVRMPHIRGGAGGGG